MYMYIHTRVGLAHHWHHTVDAEEEHRSFYLLIDESLYTRKVLYYSDTFSAATAILFIHEAYSVCCFWSNRFLEHVVLLRFILQNG